MKPEPLHFLVAGNDLDERISIGITLSRAFPSSPVRECASTGDALEYISRGRSGPPNQDRSRGTPRSSELVTEIRRAGSLVPLVRVAREPSLPPTDLRTKRRI